MSSPVKHVASLPAPTNDESAGVSTPKAKGNGNYKGFVAGVFSGIAKLSVGYVRLVFIRYATVLNSRQAPFRYDQGPPPDRTEVSIRRSLGLRRANHPP